MKRGRNQRRRQGGSNPNRALDSNGPDVRIRGTANQIYDKYTALARDASSAGDRVKAESYQQHAEHYFRMIRAMQPPQQHQSVDSDGEQPNVSDDDDNGGNDRQQNDRPNGGRNNRPRDEARGDDKADAEAKSDEKADASNDDDAGAEEKPKRRRTRRPTKAAAKSDDGDSADNRDEPATAAAE